MPLNLPTMAEVNARPHATPKWKLPTKLERAIEKDQAQREDETKLESWAREVKDLDGWKDRRTGKRLKKTRALHPLRGEAHHIEPKADLAVRYDVRNGIALALETHDAVERGKLRIVGTVFFTLAGKRYINGRRKVRFKEVS